MSESGFLQDYDYSMNNTPDSDRLVIDENDQSSALSFNESSATMNSQNSINNTVPVNVTSLPSYTDLSTTAPIEKQSSVQEYSSATSSEEYSPVTYPEHPFQETCSPENVCFNPDISLNQAIINEKSTCNKADDTRDNVMIKDCGSWYKLPSDTDQNQEEQTSVIDSVLNMEQEFNIHHSTPARTFLHQNHHSFFKDSGVSPLPVYQCPDIERTSPPTPKPSQQERQKSALRPDKPPYSYASMCIMAIHSSKKVHLALIEIRNALTKMFPYFRGEYAGWKSSVRHVLGNTKCFYKVEGSGNSVWGVDYSQVTLEMFARQRKGEKLDHYKPYLHEELGLPPVFPLTASHHSLKKGLSLPPKPCYGSQSPLTVDVAHDDDFLSGRKEFVPTPAPSSTGTVSDSDDVVVQAVKRRKTEYVPMTSVPVTSHFNKQTGVVGPTLQTSTARLPPAELLLKPPFRPTPVHQHQYGYTPYYGSYGNYGYYGNAMRTDQQQNNLSSAYWPPHDNNTRLNQWWFSSAYFGLPATDVTSWPHYAPQSGFYGNDGWYPAPLNLSKQTSKDCDTM